jgi:hypothetical protein
MMAMTRSIALALTLALAACVNPPPDLPPTGPIIIQGDGGGTVSLYIKRWNEIEASGREVKILGHCVSACTIFISLSNVCLGPKAVMKFHSADGIMGSVVNQRIAGFYPPLMREKFLAEWQHIRDGEPMAVLNRRAIHVLAPDVPFCEAP